MTGIGRLEGGVLSPGRPAAVLARAAAVVTLAGVLACCMGCLGPKRAYLPEGYTAPPPVELPTANELIRGHNARVANLEGLWARADVRLLEPNDEGRLKQKHRGEDSKLIVVLPDRLALAVGKLGQIGFWLGANGDRYWLMELQGKDKVAYVGTHEAFGPEQAYRLSLPVPPTRLANLLGFQPLPTFASDLPSELRSQRVWFEEGLFWVRPPGYRSVWFGFTGAGRLAWVRLRDRRGRPLFECRVDEPQGVPLSDRTPEAWPIIPTRYRITQAGTSRQLEIHLRSLSDGSRRIKPAVFDFSRLMRAYDVERVVDLDESSQAR